MFFLFIVLFAFEALILAAIHLCKSCRVPWSNHRHGHKGRIPVGYFTTVSPSVAYSLDAQRSSLTMSLWKTCNLCAFDKHYLMLSTGGLPRTRRCGRKGGRPDIKSSLRKHSRPLLQKRGPELLHRHQVRLGSVTKC